ncbi:hypothetical protein Cni_G07207 [Canna indica]|uniref:Uncharacterized protein n=1 Tax=Canna indica TaxID=4628 RepID=A0AAQ3K392_9LILI|nr:hypothetical protein Cni_G07207 [Canna indica]
MSVMDSPCHPGCTPYKFQNILIAEHIYFGALLDNQDKSLFCHPKVSPWFDLRVFYVRVSNCQIDETIPDHLTLNHIPLAPDTILEVNGRRSSIYSDYVSSSPRRDRIDRGSEEATFVSTDSIGMTGSVIFEVYDRDNLLLTASIIFLKNRHSGTAGISLPKVEVYVAGCFSGAPIILTKTLQLGVLNKHQRKVTLDSIPEDCVRILEFLN